MAEPIEAQLADSMRLSDVLNFRDAVAVTLSVVGVTLIEVSLADDAYAYTVVQEG